jgi:hypothetical protein
MPSCSELLANHSSVSARSLSACIAAQIASDWSAAPVAALPSYTAQPAQQQSGSAICAAMHHFTPLPTTQTICSKPSQLLCNACFAQEAAAAGIFRPLLTLSSLVRLLLLLLLQFYPRAQWPTATQLRGYGAWGGVVAVAAIYVVQVHTIREIMYLCGRCYYILCLAGRK